MLLENKRLLITGVLTPAVDRVLRGAVSPRNRAREIVLTGVGRGMSLTEKCARAAAHDPPDVLEMDANQPQSGRRAS